ncbi:TetR family transcriptional regulator [Bacillus sp. FJAT-29814]|uniref:TetR family transcriptional regulator n=1 Tax=Bacillus sp. FJAT-29814 TaxID=1729688 RepID=UPI0008377B48|nr:TetR family transcriptional regulator [Bacillus sp. FJAT-29814]
MPKVTDEHKEFRKQQILLASMEVFKRKGYEKATLKDIVEQAGMSRGWIYLYFTDKKQIFEALLTHLDAEQEQKFAEVITSDDTVFSVLSRFFEELRLEMTSEDTLYPAIYEFWITSWRDETVREFFAKRYERTVAMFSDLFHKGIDSGEFTATIPVDEITKMMMSSIDGMMVHSLAFGLARIDMKKQQDQLLRRLMELLPQSSI